MSTFLSKINKQQDKRKAISRVIKKIIGCCIPYLTFLFSSVLRCNETICWNQFICLHKCDKIIILSCGFYKSKGVFLVFILLGMLFESVIRELEGALSWTFLSLQFVDKISTYLLLCLYHFLTLNSYKPASPPRLLQFLCIPKYTRLVGDTSL